MSVSTDEYEISSSSSDDDDNDAFFCPIDKDDDENLEIATTSCEHTFCKPCFVKLRDAGMPCAMCRSSLAEKSILLPSANVSAESLADIDESPMMSNDYVIAPPLPLSNVNVHFGNQSTYDLNIVEKYMETVWVNVIGSASKWCKRRVQYTVYDIIRHNGDKSIVYEQHISIPIGGTEPPPEYIVALLKNAQRITYESRNDHTMCFCRRMRRMMSMHRKKFWLACNTTPLPSLPWQDYRFMDFVNHIYSMQVPVTYTPAYSGLNVWE